MPNSPYRAAAVLLLAVPFLFGFDNEILHAFTDPPLRGSRVAAVGDVDGDGIDDFVIGDPSFGVPGQERVGRAHLVLPRRSPLQFLRIELPGRIGATLFGKEIAALGDLNHDGLADFSVTSENQFRVDIFFGRRTWPFTTRTYVAPPYNIRSSEAIGPGDLDGDGFDDIIIATIFDGHLYFASHAIGLYLNDQRRIPNDIPGIGQLRFQRIRDVGDIDLDGRPDFVVTAETPRGTPYALHGLLYRGGQIPLDQILPSATIALWPVTTMDFFDVARGPDVDGDGRPEVLVTHSGFQEGSGRVTALSYRQDGEWTEVATLFGPGPSSIGYPALIADFDQDGDGFDDILVTDGFDTANLRVFHRIDGQWPSAPSVALPSLQGLLPAVRAHSMRTVGDVDGDGFADMLVCTGQTLFPSVPYLLRGGVTRSLHLTIDAVSAPLGRPLRIPIRARMEGNSTDTPFDLGRIEFQFRLPHWKYLTIEGVVATGPGRGEFQWSGPGSLIDMVAHFPRGVSIGTEDVELFAILVNPMEVAGDYEIDLQIVEAWSRDGTMIWTTGTDGQIVTGVATAAPTPALTGAVVAFPSPANPRTTFRVSSPEPGPMTIEIFDVRGRSLWRETIEFIEAGDVDVPWSAVDHDGSPIASGIYLVRASGTAWTATTRVSVVR